MRVYNHLNKVHRAPIWRNQAVKKERESSHVPEGVEKDWLFIYIGAGDNSLAQDILADANQLERRGSDEHSHVVAYLDLGRQLKGFNGAKVYYLLPDSDPKVINSPLLKSYGQVNTADPNFLGELIGELMNRFPAKHVAVIISDHGDGWRGAIEDYTHDSWMSLEDIKKALSIATERAGRMIDLIGWDACLMGTAEVLSALKPYAKLMVASEDYEATDGWPYEKVMRGGKVGRAFSDGVANFQSSLMFNFSSTPETLAKVLVKSTASEGDGITTLSAVDLSKVPALERAIDELGKALLRSETSPKLVYSILRATQAFNEDYRDLYDFAKRLSSSPEVTDSDLKRAARKLMRAISSAVLAEQHDPSKPNARGIAIFLPEDPRKATADYLSTDLASKTAWGKWLKRFAKQVYDEELYPFSQEGSELA